MKLARLLSRAHVDLLLCRSVLERLLGAHLVYSKGSMARALSFEYLNRQLVWHELSELLLFLLPLINVARIKALVMSHLPRVSVPAATSSISGVVHQGLRYNPLWLLGIKMSCLPFSLVQKGLSFLQALHQAALPISSVESVELLRSLSPTLRCRANTDSATTACGPTRSLTLTINARSVGRL